VNNRNQVALDYGAGLKYFLYSNVALRGDVRHIITLNDRFNNLEYTLGATIYFGGPKQLASAPVVFDADNDGVPDNDDKCPGTAIGVKVDRDGCPLDSDKDGVADYLDKCPGTPSGVAVDNVGCPLDTDMDGVPDYLDKCPGTPSGVKVDQDGCPLDSDKDGVPDYLDKCPGTPIGVTVDIKGCPPVEQIQEARAEAPAAAAVVETKQAVAAAAVAKEIFEKGRATINVEFDFDKADIKPAFDEEIQKFALVMKNYPDLKVVIEGYTDNVGKKAYNEKLSERRANSVKNYMTKKLGIEESRLTARGYGNSKPIDSNKTKMGRQKNRRVEAAVSYQIKK
jgi:OOP family OmpA-OmpF porin